MFPNCEILMPDQTYDKRITPRFAVRQGTEEGGTAWGEYISGGKMY